MNDYKYQKKPNESEEVMNSFKDFNQVLDKHKAISSSYKAIWRWAIIAASGIGIITFVFVLPEYPKEKKSNTTEVLTLEAKIEPTSNREIINKEEPRVVLVKNEKSLEKESSKTTLTQKKATSYSKKGLLDKINVSSVDGNLSEIVKTDTLALLKSREESLEAWFTLNEKTPEERIKLPTLYISNFKWPNSIVKTQLVNSPTINAIYTRVGRKIPIVGGEVYITELNSKVKPTGYKLRDGKFSPELIREIHKSGKNALLLFKDIKLLIPGRGAVSVGDLQVRIQIDNKYKKRIN